MKIVYQTQIPGKPPRETRISGVIAAIVGILVFLGFLALLLIFLLPLALLAALAFLGLILFAMIAGWIYLGFKIGFRDLWDITRSFFGFGGGRMSWDERRRKVQKEWADRAKGKPGVWSK